MAEYHIGKGFSSGHKLRNCWKLRPFIICFPDFQPGPIDIEQAAVEIKTIEDRAINSSRPTRRPLVAMTSISFPSVTPCLHFQSIVEPGAVPVVRDTSVTPLPIKSSSLQCHCLGMISSWKVLQAQSRLFIVWTKVKTDHTRQYSHFSTWSFSPFPKLLRKYKMEAIKGCWLFAVWVETEGIKAEIHNTVATKEGPEGWISYGRGQGESKLTFGYWLKPQLTSTPIAGIHRSLRN
jgi:hypothetical protein